MNVKLILPLVGFSVVVSGCSSLSSKPVQTESSLVLNRPDRNAGLVAPAQAPQAEPAPVQAQATFDPSRLIGEADSASYQADSPNRAAAAPAPTATRMKSAQEMVIYYGPTKEGAALLAPSREYLKIRDASFDDMNGLVQDAPPAIRIEQQPSGKLSNARQAKPASEDQRVQNAFAGVVGRTDLSPVPMKRALSGSTQRLDGFFQPLAVDEDTLAGRHQAQDILEAHPELFKAKGELMYEKGLGWGYFVPLESL